jgi:pimeloyl-ACP methyl ester carboxylesterase
MSSSRNWEATERTGFGQSGNYIERLIRVPLNREKKSDGYFDLYYFIGKPLGLIGRLKTVLFCAGGPGKIIRPEDKNFLEFLIEDNPAPYQIVHFHLRGSGFSQIPPPNDFDRFLRTSYAVNDIEEIRKDVLKDEPWDGIVGYSYGTVLAQQYASRYEKRVRKLILIGPLSMHKFKSVTDRAHADQVFDEYTKTVQEIRQTIVDNIFHGNEEFKKLNEAEITIIKTRLVEVFDKIEDNFSSEQFVADEYEKLKSLGKLKDAGLVNDTGQEYSRLFFKKLGELRHIGWQPTALGGLNERQVASLKVIALELNANLKKKLGTAGREEDSADEDGRADGSYRALYVIRAYDGFRPRFLKEWLARGAISRPNIPAEVRAALKKSAGRAGVNRFIEKIGIGDDKPKVWDPAIDEYNHGVPTLVLKGDADPATAGGQAEHYFEQAITGPRTFIEFKGVGHGFDLPTVDIEKPFLIGSVRIDPGEFRTGETKEVRGSIATVPQVFESDDGDVRKITRSRGRSGLEFEAATILPNGKVSVLLDNNTPQRKDTEKIELVVRHPLYKLKVRLNRSKVPPFSESWVDGTFKVFDRKIILKAPANLEPELEFIKGSEQIDPPDKVSVQIKNKSGHAVKGKPKDWIYIPDQGAEFEGPCQGIDLPALNCLIYSFLEMEHADFQDEKSEFMLQLHKQDYLRNVASRGLK